jgi:hypothetical protein
MKALKTFGIGESIKTEFETVQKKINRPFGDNCYFGMKGKGDDYKIEEYIQRVIRRVIEVLRHTVSEKKDHTDMLAGINSKIDKFKQEKGPSNDTTGKVTGDGSDDEWDEEDWGGGSRNYYYKYLKYKHKYNHIKY